MWSSLQRARPKLNPEIWLTTFFVLALGLASAFYFNSWHRDGIRERERELQLVSNLAVRWVNLKLSDLHRQMLSVAKEEIALRQEINQMDISPPLGGALRSSSFTAVGFLLTNAQGVWSFQWLSALNPVQSWNRSEFSKLIPTLPLSEVTEAKSLAAKINDPSGQPMMAFLRRISFKQGDQDQIGLLVGITAMQEFASLAMAFKGIEQEILLADTNGVGYVLPEQQAVGASVQRFPIWSAHKEVLSRDKFNFDSNGSSKIGLVNYVPQSNLLVLASTSARSFGAYAWRFGPAFVFLFILLSLAFYALVKWLRVDWNSVVVESNSKEQVPTFSFKTSPQESYVQPAPVQADTLRAVVSGLAYKLQAPLLGILGQIQVAQAKRVPTEIAPNFEFIEKEARNLKTNVDQMLKWSNSISSPKAPMQIREVINESVRQFKNSSLAKGIDVDNRIGSLERTASGHKESFSRAIVEVLRNAAEAMEDSIERKITLRSETSADRLKIIIEDTGKGIQASQVDRLFDPLFTSKLTEASVGLGLSLAFAAARSMGGRLYFEPKLPGVTAKGARFVFDIPTQVTAYEVPVEKPLPEPPPLIDLRAATTPTEVFAVPPPPVRQMPIVEVPVSEGMGKLKFKVRAPRANAEKDKSP